MKKIIFTVSAVLFYCGILSGSGMYVQPDFGMGFSYNSYNAVGFSGGLDIVWKVWEHDKKAAGRIYAGGNTGLRYWLPTRQRYVLWDTRHVFSIPLTSYGSYEFKVNAGPLSYAGPFFAPGISFNLFHRRTDNITETDFFVNFNPSFGGILVFNNNWILKQTFSWGAGPGGWDAFIIEAGYRF